MIFLENNNDSILSSLWRLAISMVENINKLWDWLNAPVNLNFKILGFTVGLPTFTPLGLLGIGLTTWIVWILIKNLVPGL